MKKPYKVVTVSVGVGRARMSMKQAQNHEGHFIGDPKFADALVKKYGITRFELRTPKSLVCSIGFNEKEKRWYGWSHRAIQGFTTREQASMFADSVS
jgi:hypothetical protein